MELLGLLFLAFIVFAQCIEGFALINIVQFFRGKKTLLEKLSDKYQPSKQNDKIDEDK